MKFNKHPLFSAATLCTVIILTVNITRAEPPQIPFDDCIDAPDVYFCSPQLNSTSAVQEMK